MKIKDEFRDDDDDDEEEKEKEALLKQKGRIHKD